MTDSHEGRLIMDSEPKRGHAQLKAGQEGIAFLVNQTSRGFKVRLSETISQYGLDTEQYTVLRHVLREISASPGGVPVSELSANLNVPVPIIEAASRKLERDGWLDTKVVGPGLLLLPTRRATAQATVLADASLWMLEGALNGFSHDEIDQLSELLKRIVRNLDVPLGEDEGPLVR
jgi:DNA-binding MarR family transcriptional regulator